MTMNLTLGRLERVDVRSVWENEALHFTPWLATEENLQLLADTIGIDLELRSVEERVGPFRADIVCTDTTTNSLVLIENQLERTNHIHLGQLLTYAAGLKAVTIVWIAEKFLEEHRAAIDWLNEVTSESVNLFALEVEVWQIGASARAPKFNIVCQPNAWTKQVVVTPQPSSVNQMYFEWWSGLIKYMKDNPGRVRAVSPQAQHWLTFSIGRSKFALTGLLSESKDRVGINLEITGESNKSFFGILELQKAKIESELGLGPLVWDPSPDKQSCRIGYFIQKAGLRDRTAWPAQQLELAQLLETFHKVFSWRVKQLDTGFGPIDQSMIPPPWVERVQEQQQQLDE